MTTQRFKIATGAGEQHAVGNLVSMDKYIQDVPNGAIATADTDNFSLVKLGFDANGERTFSPLTAATERSFLLAAVEVRYIDEKITEFYVGQGERARIIHLQEGLQIGVSAFALNTGITAVTPGQKAHWDVATKKYLLHDGTHAGYATANVKFEVIADQPDIAYTLGVPMVILEVTK